ncbi:unnamed protein product [Ceutorhynchus assimilis]|uniref:HMG box domain-containing protein n=1 Tax=Ceutorhynchus assimilis TaxID=467358 RepID=A0A9N9MUK1_9CUCU|nr:unnamed protein product [Ceutorhynchus assimilis]
MSHPSNFINTAIMEETATLSTDDEANQLLENGILLETNKGFVCMSLNEAISSNLNLSPETLREVAAQLLFEQNLKTASSATASRMAPNFRVTCDSDGGFSSECSDSMYTTTGTPVYPSCTTFASTSNVLQLPKDTEKSSEESDSTRGSMSSSNLLSCDGYLSPHQVLLKKKGRGGWPKGRKRKPELLNLPPKAPATGYNLYLNEQRSFYKSSSLQFYEITKIVGNKWSSLTLEEKKPYLDKAEEDKKRYREELKQYRQSEAYMLYLNKKRMKRLQNNVLSESDMDATDDFDEEDNEELYCRTCDQWFNSMHNKKEHLQAKKHLASVAGQRNRESSDIESSTTLNAECSTVSNSWDESSLEGSTFIANSNNSSSQGSNTAAVYEAMCNVASLVQKRENEFNSLKNRQQESIQIQKALFRQLGLLTERERKLQKDLEKKQKFQKELDSKIQHLWQVPSLFTMAKDEDVITTDFSDGAS